MLFFAPWAKELPSLSLEYFSWKKTDSHILWNVYCSRFVQGSHGLWGEGRTRIGFCENCGISDFYFTCVGNPNYVHAWLMMSAKLTPRSGATIALPIFLSFHKKIIMASLAPLAQMLRNYFLLFKPKSVLVLHLFVQKGESRVSVPQGV